MQKNTNIARVLRKESTRQERILWKLLRNSQILNFKFRRQYPIGDYIVDFVCIEKMLVIEIDGGHHNDLINKELDEKRTKYLNSRGFKVLRFWNIDIDKNTLGVYDEIIKWLKC